MIDWDKPIRFTYKDDPRKLRVIATKLDRACQNVVVSRDGGVDYIYHFTNDGRFNAEGKPVIENIPEDSEPPKEIFQAWSQGFDSGKYTSEFDNETKKERFKKSKTYKDYKNKKLTVEDV